jgi:type II secretory pathway component GspD/PulD (secretin)
MSGIGSAGLLWCAIVFVVVAPAFAADTSVPLRTEESWVASAPIIAEPHAVRLALAPEAASPNAPRDARNISLDFHAADIADVLKALSVQTGTNIVTGTDVKGQVTVTLNHVSLSEALDMVTKLSGYKYAMAAADTYVVGSAQGLSAVLGPQTGGRQEIVEAVALHRASPEDLIKVLPEQVPGVKASLGNAPATGADAGAKPVRVVLLNGTAEDVAAAKDIIAKVEDSIQSGGPDTVTEVYRIKYSDAAELGKLIAGVAPTVSVAYGPTTNFQLKQPDVMKGGTTSGPGGGGGTTQYEFKDQPATLILTGPPDDVKRVVALLEQVDVKPVQILLEAKILDINSDALRDVGVDWSWSTFAYTTGAEKPGGGADTTPQNLGVGPVQLLAKLNLLVTSGKARLLANPKIATVTGKPANIFIGDEVKYIISIQNTTTGQNIQTETAQVGIALRSIGTVGPGDEITLNLHPEVSVISSFLNLGGGIALPQIARRFTDSTIRVKSGDTVAIGGLIRDQDILTMSKVPFLGELPVLGQLFQHKSKTKKHSEVAIFITATVMKD